MIDRRHTTSGGSFGGSRNTENALPNLERINPNVIQTC